MLTIVEAVERDINEKGVQILIKHQEAESMRI